MTGAERPGKGRVKRPRWVWLISSFYISAGLWAILIYSQMSAGLKPLPPSVLAHFEGYSGSDYLLLISLHALSVIAGALFLALRKESVYVFIFKFGIGVPLTVCYALEKGALDASRPENVIVALIGWSAAALVCFYAWRLMKEGVLK